MTDLMRICSRDGCDNRFPLAVRAGRNSGKAIAGRKRTFRLAA